MPPNPTIRSAEAVANAAGPATDPSAEGESAGARIAGRADGVTADPGSVDTADMSSDELGRYGRQLSLAGFGPESQALLRSGKVLLVGAGGLGSPAAMYLAAAGVGTLGLVDDD